MTASPPPEPLEHLAQALRTGAVDLTAALEQIEQAFDRREGVLQTFLPEPNRFDRLRRRARALVERFPSPAQRPVLFGVPVGVKDVFHADGFETRAGSRLPTAELRELYGKEQARAVTLLENAGALILGKAACTELAYFAPGPTRNPVDPEHTPGGSSSGSAAAVAAGLSPLTLGTQTIGSIGRPAAFCGVVGFKPSYERISRQGVVPLAEGADHVGTFTHTVDGAALAASVLIEDWRPELWHQLTSDPQTRSENRPVLGRIVGPYAELTDDEGRERFDSACRRLIERGFVIRSVPAMEHFEALTARHRELVAAQAFRHHRRLYERFPQQLHIKTVELLEKGRSISDEALERALQSRLQLRDHLAGLEKHHGIDLWLSPAAPGPAPRGLESTGDPILNLPWTHAGLPTLVVPDLTAPFHDNPLPTGLQLAGPFNADERALAWGRTVAAALETSP